MRRPQRDRVGSGGFRVHDDDPRWIVAIGVAIGAAAGVGIGTGIGARYRSVLAVEITFWAAVGLTIYVYFGYPVALRLLIHIVGGKPIVRGERRPRVTLIISAFNEEQVIGKKIRNSLAVDYPAERLEILVVSDCSDDDTDAIVEGFHGNGVRLLRMPERGGKTVGLNEAAKLAGGEILVFSDANAMYRKDAIRAMVRNFDDPTVGAVVGQSSYSESANDAEESESLYWRYETGIKRSESSLGSVVGGDGAIYAIRSELYRPMSADALSDFVNPCQIVEQGWRCIYEPEAVSVEEAAGSFAKEFRRKVRIVNRAWRATMSMKRLMNPLRYGVFSFQMISHKLLRWLVPLFLMVAFVANVALLWDHWLYRVFFMLQVLFYSLAVAGAILRRRGALPSVLYVPFYFCLVNIASARGILQAYRGMTYTTWSTARTKGR